MSLGTEYSEMEYQDRTQVLSAAMNQLSHELQILTPGTDVLILGSVGRRLSAKLALEDRDTTSFEEYVKWARGYMRPRKNFRGNIDIDFAVSKELKWADIAGTAREVTSAHKGIEIDPHVADIREGKIVYKCRYNNKTELIDPGKGTVKLNNGESIRPLGLVAGIEYLLLFGQLREKDIGEMIMMLSVIQEMGGLENKVRSQLGLIAIGYITRGTIIEDTLKMVYHNLFPKQVREVVHILRGKGRFIPQENRFNFDEGEPVLF